MKIEKKMAIESLYKPFLVLIHNSISNIISLIYTNNVYFYFASKKKIMVKFL